MKFYIKSLLLLFILSLLACDNDPPAKSEEKQSVAKFRIVANLAAAKYSPSSNPYYKAIADAFTLAADGADNSTIVAKLREDTNSSGLIGSLIPAFEQGTASAFREAADKIRKDTDAVSRAAADAFDSKANELK